MWAIAKRETKSFLGSLAGFIVYAIFLTLCALFIWVFPGNLNIVDSGYSDMSPFFTLAPWVFLFLIPAITMRFFAEEQRNGTIELLLTKPITEFKLVFSKYLAGQILVFVGLIPTLFYYITIYQYGNPVGNVDSGAVWGSYIGLFFLSSAFVSIGTFASSLTENQVISFLLAVFLCFFVFMGFESISSFNLFGAGDLFVRNLGINEHYQSLSRGVVDTRDVVYFVSLTFFFIWLTKISIESRKW
jgi:ABC-2 type transport system permease protein